MERIIEIGDGEDFRNDWNARATELGTLNVAAFGPDSVKMFSEYYANVVSSRLISLLLLSRRDRVLDLGCGPGRIASYLAPHVYSVIGIDVSDVMLADAKQRCKSISNITFLQNNGSDLQGVEDATFDTVISYACFIHLPADIQDKYIEEIIRVLRPGGEAICHVRYDQTHKIVKRTYTGANFSQERLVGLMKRSNVARAELQDIDRCDDLVENVSHRRWLRIWKA